MNDDVVISWLVVVVFVVVVPGVTANKEIKFSYVPFLPPTDVLSSEDEDSSMELP